MQAPVQANDSREREEKMVDAPTVTGYEYAQEQAQTQQHHKLQHQVYVLVHRRAKHSTQVHNEFTTDTVACISDVTPAHVRPMLVPS